MSIRISGLVSGLDTDSMIDELVSGYEAKKNQIVKKQKSLEYKQDAWKSLNKDIYSFYTSSLSSMRLEGSYTTKSTTVSDSTKATVTASNSATYGTMELSITALAKSGYLTGADLSNLYDDTKFTSSSTLSEFGIDGTVTLEINGETVTAESTDTISTFLSNLKVAGINAGFDATNQRFYLSSTESGEENDFSLIAADSDSLTALKAMGLFSVSQKDAEAYAALGEDWATEISDNYAAYTAARRGHEVILCEASDEVGGLLKGESAIPFKYEMYQLAGTYKLFCEKEGVDIRLNTPVTREYVEKEKE